MTVSHTQDSVDQRDAEVGAALRAPAGRPILLTGGTVLTLDPAVGNLLGDVLIDDGRIAAVGVDLKAQAGEHAIVVDARHAIVMPGLIDSHLHAWLGQLRGISQGLDFPGYMQLVHGEVAAHYRPEDMYTGNLIAALVALDAGVTTILDNSHNARSLDHMSAAVQGLADAKIRAVHATAPPVDGSVPVPDWLNTVERLRERYFSSEDQLLTVRLMDLAPTEQVWRYARDHDLWVTTEMGAHVTNLGDLADAGLLTEKHTFNHCVALPENDWKRIGDAGAAVNLCTRSDTHFGLGQVVPPVDQALDAGITPGLSTDNETTYLSDMLAEMQHLVTVHRGYTFGRVAAGEQAVQLTPRQVLEFGTLGGAANCGLSHLTGSLTPGKQADVVLLRKTDVNTSLATNAFTTVVGFANRSNIDTVFVAGRIRKWRGRLVGHDLSSVLKEAAASRTYLMERAGLMADRF
ncbi:amidohydrolase family protein [Kibdelosporangium aridum]|uniref:amidohydrolase family protein n=1 Tax=Kibdelosporangium aridum TaxID=2030 RepID=UPI00069014F7